MLCGSGTDSRGSHCRRLCRGSHCRRLCRGSHCRRLCRGSHCRLLFCRQASPHLLTCARSKRASISQLLGAFAHLCVQALACNHFFACAEIRFRRTTHVAAGPRLKERLLTEQRQQRRARLEAVKQIRWRCVWNADLQSVSQARCRPSRAGPGRGGRGRAALLPPRETADLPRRIREGRPRCA